MFDIILWPFKWIVSLILTGFHFLFTALGMDPASGVTWTLAIIGLTLVMRTITIPLFLKQIKSMRGMQELQPEMAKLQAKYKGKTDQLSRQAMAQEQMELYKRTGANPLSSCLPIIVQMPSVSGAPRCPRSSCNGRKHPHAARRSCQAVQRLLHLPGAAVLNHDAARQRQPLCNHPHRSGSRGLHVRYPVHHHEAALG